MFPLSFPIIVSCIFAPHITDGVFSSMNDLMQLLERENILLIHLDVSIQKLETKIATLKVILENQMKNQKIIARDVGHHLDNPINAFLLLMRVAGDWDRVEMLIGPKFPNILEKFGFEDSNLTSIPFIVSGAIQSIIRLQRVYKLTALDMAENEIFNNTHQKVTLKMSGLHCHLIGIKLMEENDFELALEWLKVALRKAATDESVGEINILTALEISYYKAGRIEEAFDSQTELLKLVPASEMDLITREGYKTLIKTGLKEFEEPFRVLCRNGDHLPIKVKSRLKCYFLDTSNLHPFLKLQKIKTEEAHDDPKVVIFRNLISDKEADAIKLESMTELEYVKEDPSSLNHSLYLGLRVGKTFQEEDVGSVAFLVHRRLEDVSGYLASNNFWFDVFNYGLGGHLTEHHDTEISHDAFLRDIRDFGDLQLATMNGYLETVSQGGETAFTNLGIAVKPVKGSVMFWKIYHDNGTLDARMRHGACPVLNGNKWTLFRAMSIRGNELTHPCLK